MRTKAVLVGKLITLRPFRPKDMLDALAYAKKDNSFSKYINRSFAKNTKAEQMKIYRGWQRDPNLLNLAIETNHDKKMIGSARLQFQDNNDWAVFGVVLYGRHFFGKGYGSEATMLMRDYAFAHKKIYRLELTVFTENKVAIHVYEKCGFVIEGTYRKGRKVSAKKRWSSHFMSILRPEWLKLTKNGKRLSYDPKLSVLD